MATLSLKRSSTRLVELRQQKQKRVENRQQAVKWRRVRAYQRHLRKTYPAVFDPKAPKPLQLHIHQALAKVRPEGVGHKTVRLALAMWCRGPVYLRAVAEGGHRFNLAGMPAGTVSPEHQANARQRLAIIEAKRKQA